MKTDPKKKHKEMSSFNSSIWLMLFGAWELIQLWTLFLHCKEAALELWPITVLPYILQTSLCPLHGAAFAIFSTATAKKI